MLRNIKIEKLDFVQIHLEGATFMAPTTALCDDNNESTTLVSLLFLTKKLDRSKSMSDWQWKIMMNLKWHYSPLNHQILDQEQLVCLTSVNIKNTL